MARVINTRKEVRIINGKEQEVVIQTLAPGNGGRSISKQFFGGKKGIKNKSRNGQMGLQESKTERDALHFPKY